MAGSQEIILERDGHDQPWGFRLQGGSDVGMPLSIQRVLVGTPSEGVLKKGDILLRISRTDTKGLTHQQAADLFTNVGNQISLQFKRPGSAPTPIANANCIAPPQPLPVSGGGPHHGFSTTPSGRSPETLLFKNRGGTQQGTSAPLSLTIQNQPYRTSPLIQPSAKADIGPGSILHLKIQADYITGAKEALPALDPRATEFTMKQKVTGTLQQIHQSTSPPSPPISHSPVPMQSQLPVKQYYNNPINLYSNENVAEVAKLNKMGVSGLPAPVQSSSPTGLINPNKPHQVVFAPPKDYNPKESATWLALQESDPSITDPEKLKNFTTLREHDPIYSEVYEAPKHPLNQKQTAPRPGHLKASHNITHTTISNSINDSAHLQPERSRVHSPPTRSPVAGLLPASHGGNTQEKGHSKPQDASSSEQSAVLLAALAESKSVDMNSSHLDYSSIPLYETNSIGGRKRIAQSASFNKLMMDVLGE